MTPPHPGGRHRSIRVALTAAVVLAALGASCSVSFDDRNAATTVPANDERTAPSSTVQPADPSTSGFPADWTPAPLDWSPCEIDPGLDCSELDVPRDWAKPDGPTVTLALARRPATGTSEGTLLTNPGGPGGSGVDFIAGGPLSDETEQRFDTVSWDPRGVGASTAITCDAGVEDFVHADSQPDTPQEQSDLDAAAAQISADCAREAGDLLPFVGTANVARDMEAIRLALGGEPLNYVGFSYGTQIGQEYAALFPTHIRSMVLDGVVDPSLSFTEFLTAQAQAFEQSFNANAIACADVGVTTCGVSDLAATYDRVIARAETEPLRTPTGSLGPSEIAVAATYSAYVPEGWRELGPALASADLGDGGKLADLAASYYDFGGYPSYAAVVCIDAPPPAGPAAYREFSRRATEAAPRFGAAVANEMLPCATWPAPAVADPVPSIPSTVPPILVVGNTGDPATPYSNALAVANRTPNAVLLTVETDGHTAYGSSTCVDDIVDAYLIDLTLPPPDTTCR